MPKATEHRVPLSPDHMMADPLDYFVPPPPKEGVTVGGRIDKEMKARISELVQNKRHVFRVESDVVRTAIHWFMQEKIAPRENQLFQDDMERATLLVINAQKIARVHGGIKFADQIGRSLLDLWEAKAEEEAVTLWGNTYHFLRGTAEPFKGTAIRRLQEMPGLVRIRQRVVDEGGEV